MVKTARFLIPVEADFHQQVKAKSAETGVPVSEVVRRALEAWLITGELPTVPTNEAQPATARKATSGKARKRKATPKA